MNLDFGLKQDDLLYLRREVFEPLKAAGLKVFCFGSRARGDYKPFSDVDIMLEGMTSAEHETLVSRIHEKLVNSNFPYKVDLVDHRNFASSYLDSYEREKIEM